MAAGESFDNELTNAVDSLDLLVRRLRLLSPRAWRSHRGVAQAALSELVEIADRVEGHRLVPPDVPDHVIPDALAVVGGDLVDAIRAKCGMDVAPEVSAVVRRALDATR